MGKVEKLNLKNISLSESSIKEIIILLSDIDVKITALNESSAKDFLTLNSNLKENFKLAKDISSNAKELFEILSGKDRNYLLNKLDTFNTGLKFQIEGFSDCVVKGSKVVETIQGLFDSMFIPIKNFNQNLMTINFLLANLKLNVTYLKQEQSIFEKSDMLMNKIKEVKESYDIFNSKVNKLKILSDSIKSYFVQLKNKQTLTLETILEQVQTSVTVLSARYQEASVQMPQLTQKTEHYFENVSKIITNLQFHDIIRQKMEHVQNTHKEIINELNNFDFEDNKATLTDDTSKFLQIRDIAGIQVAQLIHTNQEYQTAIEKITKDFLEIGDDMKAISEMCNNFSGYSPMLMGSRDFKSIESNLETSIDLIKKFGSDGELFISKVTLIVNAVSELKNEIAGIDKEFEFIKTGLTDIFHILKPKEQKLPAIYRLGKQLSDISKSIKNELNTVSSQFKDAENETVILETLLEDNFETKFNINLDKFSESIYSVVKILNMDNAKVEEILKQNGEFGGRLSMDIKASIEEVKYYDFFEQIIEEIIGELTNIYIALKSDLTVDIKDISYDLESLKERYTMESQRSIHEKVLGDLAGEENKETDIEEDDDDDIEFF